jgi:hypothetical protein
MAKSLLCILIAAQYSLEQRLRAVAILDSKINWQQITCVLLGGSQPPDRVKCQVNFDIGDTAANDWT